MRALSLRGHYRAFMCAAYSDHVFIAFLCICVLCVCVCAGAWANAFTSVLYVSVRFALSLAVECVRVCVGRKNKSNMATNPPILSRRSNNVCRDLFILFLACQPPPHPPHTARYQPSLFPVLLRSFVDTTHAASTVLLTYRRRGADEHHKERFFDQVGCICFHLIYVRSALDLEIRLSCFQTQTDIRMTLPFSTMNKVSRESINKNFGISHPPYYFVSPP